MDIEGRPTIITMEGIFDKAMESQCSCGVCHDIRILIYRQIKAQKTIRKYDQIWTEKEKDQLTQSEKNILSSNANENLEKS